MPTVTQAQPSPGRQSGVLVIPLDSAAAHPFTQRELAILQALVGHMTPAAMPHTWLRRGPGAGSMCVQRAELEALAEKLEAEALAQ